jgi:peptidyl-prolyl cis-trans isomerase C
MTIISRFRRRSAVVALMAGLAVMAATGWSAAQDSSSQSPSGDTVVARLNGDPITENDLLAAARVFRDQVQQMPGDPRTNLINLIVNMRLAAKAATADGLDNDPVNAAQMALVRDQTLYIAYIRSKVADVLTEAAARKRYDEEIAKFVPGDEIHVQHILVDSEDEAKAIIADLDAGGDFAAIAKDKSKDPGSASSGGDLGFIKHGQTVPAFEDAAFALDVGQYTKTPVQSQFGWHVIKVDEKRPESPPAFEDELRRIQSDLFSEAYDKAIADLRASATIAVVPPPEPTPPDAAEPPADAEPAQPAKP